MPILRSFASEAWGRTWRSGLAASLESAIFREVNSRSTHLVALCRPPARPASPLLRFFQQAVGVAGRGWGLAGFHARRAVYFARLVNSTLDEIHKSLEAVGKSDSPVILVHAGSGAEQSVSGVPPFLWKEWMLCEDGMSEPESKMPLSDMKPFSACRGEWFFMWLIEAARYAPEPIEALAECLRNLRENGLNSSFRFVLSNGHELWACSVRSARSEPLPLYRSKEHVGWAVSSEPLHEGGRDWAALAEGRLYVFLPDGSSKELVL
jgi:predicted glutamine amidotransferase